MNNERELTRTERSDTIRADEEADMQRFDSLTDFIDHMIMGAFTRKLAQRDLHTPRSLRRDDDLD